MEKQHRANVHNIIDYNAVGWTMMTEPKKKKKKVLNEPPVGNGLVTFLNLPFCSVQKEEMASG